MSVNVESTTDTKEAVDSVISSANGTELEVKVVEPKVEVEDKNADASEDSEDENGLDSAEGEETTPEEGAGKKKTGFQKRINKLSTRARLAEEEAAHWKQQALQHRHTEPEKQVVVATVTQEKPKPDSYDTHADYIEALTDWKVDQKIAATEAKKTVEKQAEANKKRQELWDRNKDAAREVYEDFDEVTEVNVPVTPIMAEVMVSSDMGAHIAYYLCKNPKQAEKIAAMNHLDAARALGKIEAKLEAEKTTTNEEPTERPVKKTAPKPVTPIKSGGAGGVKNPDEMSFQEYKQFRKEQELKRRGR